MLYRRQRQECRYGNAIEKASQMFGFFMGGGVPRIEPVDAVKGAKDLLPDDKKAAVNAAFTDEDISNLQFFANIPAGVEDMEGKTLEKIKAATGSE